MTKKHGKIWINKQKQTKKRNNGKENGYLRSSGSRFFLIIRVVQTIQAENL
jgi:hypothetical protein